jgi:uncharacterized peroxidase-related enzyme
MPHIPIPENLFGIRGLMAFRPAASKPLNDLVDVLLRQPNSLTPAERELIATFVSSENDCLYCQTIHGAVAAHDLGDEDLVRQVKADFNAATISDKLKALLVIAGQVQRGGKHVTTQAVEQARALGATDEEIHDTVLIAAAFCMYNRYVDGLATVASEDPEFYRQRAAQICANGYAQVNKEFQASR